MYPPSLILMPWAVCPEITETKKFNGRMDKRMEKPIRIVPTNSVGGDKKWLALQTSSYGSPCKTHYIIVSKWQHTAIMELGQNKKMTGGLFNVHP